MMKAKIHYSILTNHPSKTNKIMFLAYKPLLMEQRHGRGRVIGFTVGPNFRAYMDGLNVLFLNALFRGPAHAGPAGTE